MGEMSIESLLCSTAHGWKNPRKVLELGVEGHAVRGRAAGILLADAKVSKDCGEGSDWSSYEQNCHVFAMGAGIVLRPFHLGAGILK